MSRSAMRQVGWVAILAILGVALPQFQVPAYAAAAPQRAMLPVDGTDCLLITGTAPEGAPRVLGGRQPLREEFFLGDELYVGGPGIGDLTVGQRLQFVRSYGEVRHPDTNKVIADAIGLLGFAEVLAVDTDRALVLITKSCREIEVGEYLLEPIDRAVPEVSSVPDFDSSRLITPDDADPVVILGDLESVISEDGDARVGTAAKEAYGQRDVVIMDQGTDGGWAAGDLVTMYRAELALRTRTSAAMYTPRPLAIGFVIAVGDSAAAILIVEGDASVQIGDRVRKVDPANG